MNSKYKLLLESGAAGHILNLSDDRDLTFTKIKKILSDAANEKLKYTEKVDGANIFLSFRDGNALYARNKGDLLNLGKNINDLINRDFKGGENIKKVYISAFKSFENTIKQLSDEIIEKIFDNGTVFYNTEILGPAFKNVINYDKNYLIIHNIGHKKIVSETKEIIPFKNENIDNLLNKIINKLEKKEINNNFKLKKDLFIILKNPLDNKDLKIAKTKLDKIILNNNLNDSNTIEDYLKTKLFFFVKETIPELSDNIHSIIVQNILGNDKLQGKLPEGIPKDTKKRIFNISNEGKKSIKDYIFPIEEIIHDFAVELLKETESSYILNNEKEINRIKQNLEKIITIIQNSSNEEAIKVLNKQLLKLKDLKNINTAIEGVVFEYGNKIYKFTGNFAPINQIFGLFKYGRGSKIPKLDNKEIKEGDNNIGKTIAIFPGSFKPPHVGHYEVIEKLNNNPQIDKIYIFISPKSRDAHTPYNKISITKEMSLKIWKIYTNSNSKIKIILSSFPSPIEAVYNFIQKFDPGDRAILVQGKKEQYIKDNRFERAQEWVNRNNLNISIDILSIEEQAHGINSTEIRKFILNNKEKEFYKCLPQHLSPQEKYSIWNIVNFNNNSITEIIKNSIFETIQKNGNKYCVYSKNKNKNLGCYNSKEKAQKRLGQIEYFKHKNEKIDKSYQDIIKKTHKEKKKNLIATGLQNTGMAYPNKPDYERSKSAPPGFGAMGENEENNSKKEIFVMNKEKNELDELSTMSGGSVEGGSISKNKQSREEFYKEQKLRKFIKENIISYKNNEIEKNKLRYLIKLILESEISNKTSHSLTGLNILEDLLKRILPILEEGYKSLTTDKEQRKSYRSHIINAVENSIIPDKVRKDKDRDREKGQYKYFIPIEEEKEDINVKIDSNDESENDKFINIEKKPENNKEDEEEKEINDFSINGEDITGRNMALEYFDKVENIILDSYDILANEEDEYVFYSYLIENLKLYMDKWEEELQANIIEPESNI